MNARSRWAAAVLSYVFGVVILATTINVVASLLAKQNRWRRIHPCQRHSHRLNQSARAGQF
jgi:hypothetical protein